MTGMNILNPTPLRCDWLYQESWCHLWRVDIWEYTADLNRPMGFVCNRDITLGTRCLLMGTQMEPDRHFITDFGSIPPPVEALPSFSRTRFIHSYLPHDSGYKHGGLWIKTKWDTEHYFVRLTKLEVDVLLWYWLEAEGANWYQRSTIYRMVRMATPWVKYPQEPRQATVM